jgi:Beta-lactamase enzyme family
MKPWRFLLFSFVFALTNSHAQQIDWDTLLRTTPALEKVFKDSERYQLEIIVDVITKKDGHYSRNHHAFQPFPNLYFYPASLVKLPTSIFACEKINALQIPGLNLQTPMRFSSNGPCQKALEKDAFNQNSLPHLGGFIRKALTVSDNSAYSRLYEWVGPAYYVQRFKELNMPKAVIRKKFDGCTVEESRCVNTIAFINGTEILYQQAAECYDKMYTPPMSEMGIGKKHKEGKKLINTPKDFSQNNCLLMKDVHELMIALCLPTASEIKLNLSDEQRKWMMESMQLAPGQLHDTWKNDTRFHDHYYNFFVYGDKADTNYTELRITNIVGLAYGYTAESAMIEDDKGNTFFISAKLYTNNSDIAGSGEYPYAGVAMPFMRDLGLAVYHWVLSQP